MEYKTLHAQDVYGNALKEAICTVYVAGTTNLASVFDALGSAKSNPFLSGATDGSITFAAADGLYDINVVTAGHNSTIQSVQLLSIAGVTESIEAAKELATTYFAATKSAGDTLAASLADGATVIVEADESVTPAGVKVRYTVVGGALTSAVIEDAGKVRFTTAGVGAVARTAQDKMREVVSVKDFGAVGDGVTDDTAAVQAAIDSENAVLIPEGRYLVGALYINKNNFSLCGLGYNASVLVAKAEPIIVINVATTQTTSGTRLEDFQILGNSTALGGLKLGTASYAATGPALRLVHIWNFSKSSGSAGFGLNIGSTQNCDIENCFIYRNRHNVQRLSTGSGYATSVRIHGKLGYLGGGSGSLFGAYIDARIQDFYLEDVVVESNEESGIYFTANAVETDKGSTIYISKVYFEANNASGGGVVRIAGSGGSYAQHRVTVDKCFFATNSGYNIVLDHAIAYVSNNQLTPGSITTTANCYARFETNRYPAGQDYIAEYKALLGSIIVTDFMAPGTSTDRNQFNFLNSLTFPDVARLVTDPYTLDDYREGVWTPVPSSDGTPPTFTPHPDNSGTYTKIGNMVHVRCVIRGTISSVGSGVPRVDGLPFMPSGFSSPSFGLTNILTGAITSAYTAASQDYVILNGPVWNTSSDSYLMFSMTYLV